MTDSDRASLASNAGSPVQIHLPEKPALLRLLDDNQKQSYCNPEEVIGQPMLSTLALPGQPEPAQSTVAAPFPYSAFSPWRRRFILTIVTVAGFFGPLAGGIYLPALPVLEHEFQASATAINITVSVFMLTFAVGVSRNAPVSSLVSAPDPSFAVAPVLVEFRRLEGSSTVIPDLNCHLHRFEYSPRRRPGQLWRLSLPTYCAGVWKLGRGVHGRRLRC